MIGFVLILIPAYFYTDATPFPGLAALPPCLGAALIIAAGEEGNSFVGNMLSWRPVVFIGLISYSLYLWHWPILVFQNTNRILLDRPEGNFRSVKIAVFLLSLVVATASWRWVETPMRRGRLRPARKGVFLTCGISLALVTIVGIFIIATGGMPSRFTQQALEVSEYGVVNPTVAWREGTCFLTPADRFSQFNPTVCLHDGDSRMHILLLGDSLAAHLYPGLSTVFPDVEFWQANAGNCLPFVHEPTPPLNAENCLKISEYVFGDFLLNHHPDEVLLSAHWSEEYLPELENTVRWLQQHGIRVTVLGPPFEYDIGLPRLLFSAIRDNNPAEVRRHWVAENRDLDQRIGHLAREKWRVGYISEFEDLCTSSSTSGMGISVDRVQGCPVFAAPGVPLIFDKFHLTAAGSVLYAQSIRAHKQLP